MLVTRLPCLNSSKNSMLACVLLYCGPEVIYGHTGRIIQDNSVPERKMVRTILLQCTECCMATFPGSCSAVDANEMTQELRFKLLQ